MSRELARKILLTPVALAMYANEPCRICGKPIYMADTYTAVWAGYSKDNTSRAAHLVCWEARPPADQWAKE